MTAPTEPTPGAPAAEPTPQAIPTPAQIASRVGQAPASTTPAPPRAQSERAEHNLPLDMESLPANVQKAITDLRAENASLRGRDKPDHVARARQELLSQFAKAVGLETDEPPDPAELTSQIEQAQADAWRSSVELQVFRHAPQHADALLDSLKFIDSLDELVEMDPRSPEFATALEAKVQEAVAGKANGQAPVATAPRPDPSQGARGLAPAKRATNLREAIERHYRPGG